MVDWAALGTGAALAEVVPTPGDMAEPARHATATIETVIQPIREGGPAKRLRTCPMQYQQ